MVQLLTMMRKRNAGLNLEAMVASGESEAYEALELYKSRVNRAKLKGENTAALQTAASGCSIMLKHKYLNAGIELGFLYVSLLEEIGEDMNEDSLRTIDDILASFPVSNIAEQASFLVRCVEWSEKCGQRKYGDVALRQRLGICNSDTASQQHSCVTILSCFTGTWSLGEEKRSIYNFAVAEAPLNLWNLVILLQRLD